MAICSPRFIHYVAVLWCFGYLGFFRTCHHFGFAPNPPVANAVQLLITLRLIGVAFEIVDSWSVDQKLSENDSKQINSAERERLQLVKEMKNVNVSPLGLICYAYCYIGLFTGPYFKYRTFQDFVDWPDTAPPIPADQLLQQLQEAPFFGVSYLILSHFYTIEVSFPRSSPFIQCSARLRVETYTSQVKFIAYCMGGFDHSLLDSSDFKQIDNVRMFYLNLCLDAQGVFCMRTPALAASCLPGASSISLISIAYPTPLLMPTQI
ncbi:unnamed protein product [Echinostoma caproni]|uniref:Lysophospholipid acyltransferase 1 n=1 Tax=Echinostoma caproni TaxID=27848 RepID=A0A182ZZP8_9TREM|nr:unnamed protein product [Echinostoma caproni]